MMGEMKTVFEVRGITLNYNSSQLVNFDAIKFLVLKSPANTLTVTVHTSKKIKRKGWGARVFIITEPEDKIYRILFFRRRRRDENTPVQFGYK